MLNLHEMSVLKAVQCSDRLPKSKVVEKAVQLLADPRKFDTAVAGHLFDSLRQDHYILGDGGSGFHLTAEAADELRVSARVARMLVDGIY